MEVPRQKVSFEFGYACDVGRKRKGEPNQDAVEVILPDSEGLYPTCLVVADGLGGHLGGSTASKLVVQAFKEEFLRSQHPTDYLLLLDHCAKMAHKGIRELGAQDPNLFDMGSTVVAVVIEKERIYLLNVGDSRAYILREGNIIQVSQDQSWVADQIRNGLLTIEESLKHPNRSRLNMAIAAKRLEIIPYSAEEKIESNDILVLCSDGLWGVIPESVILATAIELQPQIAADKLIALANQSQGPDNISVIIARQFIPDRRGIVSVEDTNPGI